MADPTPALAALFNNLKSYGTFSYLIPWILLYGLFYGLMAQIDAFKKDKKVHTIVALALSLLALYALVTIRVNAGADSKGVACTKDTGILEECNLASYLPALTGYSGLYLIVLLFLAMFPAMLGLKWEGILGAAGEKIGKHKFAAALAIIGVPMLIYFTTQTVPTIDTQGLANIVVLVIIGAIVLWTMGGEEKSGDDDAVAAGQQQRGR